MPIFFDANRGVPRNEGAAFQSGQKLWKRAKQVIPGGSMLLSKRPEMLLPEHWPTYFSRAKGCRDLHREGVADQCDHRAHSPRVDRPEGAITICGLGDPPRVDQHRGQAEGVDDPSCVRPSRSR